MPAPTFKKTCPYTIFPPHPLFLIFQTPLPLGEVFQIYFTPSPSPPLRKEGEGGGPNCDGWFFFLVLNSVPATYCTFCLVYCMFHFAFPFCCTSSLFFSLPFLKHLFTRFHVGLNSLSNIFSPNFILFPSNYAVLPFVCIVNIISSLIQLHFSLVFCF